MLMGNRCHDIPFAPFKGGIIYQMLLQSAKIFDFLFSLFKGGILYQLFLQFAKNI